MFAEAAEWKVRIKQKTVMFNGIELPEPLIEEPEEGQVLYVPDTSSHYLYTVYWYKKADIFERKLKQGLLHSNKENAIAWAKAMIPFPQNT